MIPLNSLQLDKDMPAENAGIFFLKILHIVYVAQKINKKEVIKMKKTVSLTSTILMTIYTALVTILNLGIFAIAAVFGHLSGRSLTKGWMVDGTDLGPLASSTSAIASTMILVVAFVLLILTITLIVATVLSYKFIGSGKFKNDAWMKIVIFGISLLGFVFTTDNYGFMAFCEAVFLAIPIGLSVVVLCDDSESDGSEDEDEKEPETKEPEKEPKKDSEEKESEV